MYKKKFLFILTGLLILIFFLTGKLIESSILGSETNPSKEKYKVKFYRGDYKERQQKAFEDGAICYVEQHFNAWTDSSTNYTIVLIADNASSYTRKWAQYYADKISEKFGLEKGYDNGIKVVKDGDRGYGNIRHAKMPAILLEPFFLSNSTGLEWGKTKQEDLAKILVESIYKFFPQGGLIAFSTGHRYKVSSPDDKGAGPFEGIYEIEFIEPVMAKAAKILDPEVITPEEENIAKYSPKFDEICTLVEENFYNPDFIDKNFDDIKEKYRNKAINSSYDGEFGAIINNLLGELGTSHTNYYIKDSPEYYQLASIFGETPDIKKIFGNKEILYPATGILTKKIDGKNFIISILDGSEAEKEGLKKGDEILSVDGLSFFTIRSFIDKPDGVTLKIKRSEKEEPFEVKIKPSMLNPKEEFLKAQQASVKIFEEKDKKIGYIHIWSFAGEEYYKDLVNTLTKGKLKDADGLVMDLRDGWGGSPPSYLDIFNQSIPSLTMIDGKGKIISSSERWKKPVVFLINNRTRSGKEFLAYGLKKYKRGTLIGEKTPGSTMAGEVFSLSDGSILYLAVMATRIDGENIEGKGVEPDISVPMDIKYIGGKDSQLEKALEYL